MKETPDGEEHSCTLCGKIVDDSTRLHTIQVDYLDASPIPDDCEFSDEVCEDCHESYVLWRYGRIPPAGDELEVGN